MLLHEVDLWNRALSRLGDLRVALATAKTVSAATAANPVVCTSTSHGYSTGDLVLLTAMDQMTPVNGRVFKITVVNANSFSLDDEDGSAYTAETSGGLARKLTAPNGGAIGKHGGASYDAWTRVRDEVLRDHPWNAVVKYGRLARLQASKTITGATAASPVVITATSHGYSQGDSVLIENVGGMVELNDRYFTVGTAPTANTFQLAGEDGTTYTAYTSGGTAKKALTPLKPDFNYGYRYTLPTDCLRVLELVDPSTGTPLRIPWEVVGRELYTDQGVTAPLRYCRLQKDVTQYDPQLASALAARLASEMAEELTQNTTKRAQAQDEYDRLLLQARRADALEQSHNEPDQDDWELARL